MGLGHMDWSPSNVLVRVVTVWSPCPPFDIVAHLVAHLESSGPAIPARVSSEIQFSPAHKPACCSIHFTTSQQTHHLKRNSFFWASPPNQTTRLKLLIAGEQRIDWVKTKASAQLKKNSRNFRLNREMPEKILIITTHFFFF